MACEAANIGKVVLVRARLIALEYDPSLEGGGTATIRVASAASVGSRPGWKQITVPFLAIKRLDREPPDDDCAVPYAMAIEASAVTKP